MKFQILPHSGRTTLSQLCYGHCFFFILLMCVGVLFTCITVYPVCVWHPLRPEEEIRSSRSGITDGYKLPRGAMNLNWVFWKSIWCF